AEIIIPDIPLTITPRPTLTSDQLSSIPTQVPTAVPTSTPVPTATQTVTKPTITPNSNQRITKNTYTVVEGDSLWDISVRAYGNGYRWVDIARANKLMNPDLIYPGNVFVL